MDSCLQVIIIHANVFDQQTDESLNTHDQSSMASTWDRFQKKGEDGWPKSMFHDTQAESVHFSNYAFHCQLSPCLCAVHCLLSLCNLRASLCTCPTHASTQRFTVYFPCACIYALASALAPHMPLCVLLSSFPAHAWMHCTVYSPFACLYAFHCLLSLRMPPCVSLSILHMPLYISLSTLRMPLCSSLSTFRAHASTHLPFACLYWFYCAVSLRMPAFRCPTLQPELWGRTSRTTFVLKSCDFAAGPAGTYFAEAGTYFPYYFCT